MSSFNLKESVSRKPIFKLSTRQRRKIRNEIRSNMERNKTVHATGAVEGTSRIQEDTSTDCTNPQLRDIYQKITNLESIMMKRLDECVALLEKVLQQQQQLLQQQPQVLQQQLQVLQQHRGIPSKPAFLPISSVPGMTEFDNIEDDGYREAVNYLEYVGGFNLKEAVTLCFKETFSDCVITSYSWLGREENKVALCETRAARAIHDAVLHNRHFPSPSRKEVAECLKVALRTAKERVRSRRSGPRNPQPQSPIMDNLWTAEEEQAGSSRE